MRFPSFLYPGPRRCQTSSLRLILLQMKAFSSLSEKVKKRWGEGREGKRREQPDRNECGGRASQGSHRVGTRARALNGEDRPRRGLSRYWRGRPRPAVTTAPIKATSSCMLRSQAPRRPLPCPSSFTVVQSGLHSGPFCQIVI